MPIYNGGTVNMGSGVLYSETMTGLGRATNVSINFNVPRANVNVLGRGKPLEQRPVINYIPVEFSTELIQSSTSTAAILGLVNSSNIITNITDTRAATATYGIRNVNVLFAPTNSLNYNGQLTLKSGVLNSYSLQGSVGEPVTCSLSMGFFDMTGSVINTPRVSTNVQTALVKPEGQVLTGIQFSGYGITGVTMQSFSFGVTFNRASVQQLGSQFPVERPLTDVNATLQVQGYMEGINNSLTGLNQYACGNPTFGQVSLQLQPACATSSPQTITITNPYLESQSVTSQVGNFSTVALSFSMPIGPNPNETTDGSVVTIT